MSARHVFAHRRMTIAPLTRMHRNAATAKLHVHHRRRRADPAFFAEVAMGHRVQPIAESDVVVDVHPRLLPLRDLVALGRQRQERSALDRLE